MATTPEGKVKEGIKKMLRASGAWYTMPIGTGFGVAGVPDFIICSHGRFIAVEAKAGKGKTTALQDKQIRDIKAAGGTALIINETNLGDLKKLLDNEV